MVELMMATAVTGIIVSFLGTAIYQMLGITEYGNDRLTAMHELQNTAHWLSLDGPGATSATGDNELVLTLADNSTIIYSLVGTKLYRSVDGASMVLARNIADARFTVANRIVTMTITSSPPGKSGVRENGTYQVYLRPTVGEE